MSLHVRLSTGFFTHRKTLRLKARLGDAAYWLPPRLWTYAAQNQADGDLSNYSDKELALILDYQGDANCEDEGVDAYESALAYIEQLEMQSQQGDGMGVLTGFYDLDKRLRGLRPGNLAILAGRPGHGKTSLAMSVIERVLDDEHAATVFSLEMRHHELSGRRAAFRSGLSVETIETFPKTKSYPAEFKTALGKIGKGKLRIYDKIKNFAHFRALARKDAHKRKPSLIVVDYLQLFRGDGKQNRNAEVSDYSSGMKNLAKELNAPILCLSQLNRSNEKEERPPRLSDLRDSGSIEQDADIVLLIHRNEKDAKGDVIPVTLEVAKHRNGRTGKVQLQFRQSLTRFENPSRVIEGA